MRMGYHRDPSHYPKISVFHAEMRRRIWSTIVVGDILAVAQVCLPKLINESQVDTKPPRNLLDEDCDEQTAELPSSRPDTESTLMSYAIMKYRLTVVSGMIAEQATSIQVVSYTNDVMRLDKILHEVHDSMPLGLRMRPIVSSVIDSSALIVRRFTLWNTLPEISVRSTSQIPCSCSFQRTISVFKKIVRWCGYAPTKSPFGYSQWVQTRRASPTRQMEVSTFNGSRLLTCSNDHMSWIWSLEKSLLRWPFSFRGSSKRGEYVAGTSNVVQYLEWVCYFFDGGS
jgi:hypothetical protein